MKMIKVERSFGHVQQSIRHQKLKEKILKEQNVKYYTQSCQNT